MMKWLKSKRYDEPLAFGADGCKILLFDEKICRLRRKKSLRAIGKNKM